MARLFNWLRYDVWGTGLGALILLFVCVAAACSFFFFDERARPHRKTIPELATITGFGIGGTKYHPGLTAVYAQDSLGVVGVASARPYRLFGCNVGDKIRAERYGISLTLNPAPCPIKLAPSQAR